jgi:hypothetical protein
MSAALALASGFVRVHRPQPSNLLNPSVTRSPQLHSCEWARRSDGIEPCTQYTGLLAQLRYNHRAACAAPLGKLLAALALASGFVRMSAALALASGFVRVHRPQPSNLLNPSVTRSPQLHSCEWARRSDGIEPCTQYTGLLAQLRYKHRAACATPLEKLLAVLARAIR